MTKPRIFISYSSQDGEWAQAFAQSLELLGVEAWIDREKVAPGQAWPTSLEKALRESDVIAVIVNPAETFRPELLFEIGCGGRHRETVSPYSSEKFEPSQLPYPLRIRQAIQRGTPEATAKKLAAAAAMG